MRKEVICYITTNEEGEEVAVQRVAEDPQFVLVRVGQVRLVLNKAELVNAIETCDYYGAAFDEERRMSENKVKLEVSRARAAQMQASQSVSAPATPQPIIKKSKPSKMTKEAEGTIIMDEDFSRGPTDSELAAQKLASKLLKVPEGL